MLVPAERAGAVNASTQRFRQQITAAVSVVSVVLDYRHAERGAAEEGPLTALIAAERAALLNWPHPQANRSTMQLASTGRLLRYKDALLWWQDIYQVEYQIQL